MIITKVRDGFYLAECKGLRGYGTSHFTALRSCLSGLIRLELI
jgi:hypothetical protein